MNTASMSSLVRVYRFDRLLRTASALAPLELQRLTSEIAEKLGLAAAPTIL